MTDSCFLCSDLPSEKRCAGFGCWAASMPLLNSAELDALERPRLCVTCEARPALVGKRSNHCEECGPDSRLKYQREPSLEEQLLNDQLEANGSSLEGSVRTPGGGLSRGWSGARLSDYEVSNDD